MVFLFKRILLSKGTLIDKKGKGNVMIKGKIFTYLGKIILSGINALVILTIFSYFYYNVPVHDYSAQGATDYKWESNVFYSRGTEGFALGRTNNEGYTNLFDYDEEVPIDVLVMGSSHMEAYQVAMNESTASRLNALLEVETVYNIGVSGHNFLVCAGNLEAAIEKYKPTGYVVIETSGISFLDDELISVINGSTEEVSTPSNGLVGRLQKNQYLRLLYKQIQNYNQDPDESTGIDIASMSNAELENNTRLLEKLLQKMSSIAQKGNTKLIIAYHPGTKIEFDGKLRLVGDRDRIDDFKVLCDNNGIILLDMSERFTREYNENHILPYGFSNSSVGSGHLNKYGHKMMADELYKLITEVE